MGSQVEGCVADDELGLLYVGEENVGIWRYDAEPTIDTERTLVDSTGVTGHLTADVEGLTLAYGPPGGGYLIASSQGSDEFVVYRRTGANEHLATFQIVEGNGIDGVTHSDWIDVLEANLGLQFPRGVFVTQDQRNDGAHQNFKLVPWQDIETLILEGPPVKPIKPNTGVGLDPAPPTPTSDYFSYVARVDESSIVLAWGTADSFGRDSPAAGAASVFLDDQLVATVHDRSWTRLDGLESGRAYSYRLELNGWTSTGTVRTHPTHPAGLSFLVIGDYGTGTTSQRQIGEAMAATVAARRNTDSPVRFVLTVGDNIYRDDGSQWMCPWLRCPGSSDEDRDWGEKFIDPYREILDSVPFYPTLGNHEGNESEETGDLETYVDNFFLADRLPSPRYYSFTFGDLVEFFALDTTRNSGRDKPKHPMYLPNGDQDSWLKTALTESRAQWKIPFFHHPPLTVGPNHESSYDELAHFVRHFEANGIRVVFTGHEHNLQIFESSETTGNIRYIVTGAGGALNKSTPDRQEFTFKGRPASSCSTPGLATCTFFL